VSFSSSCCRSSSTVAVLSAMIPELTQILVVVAASFLNTRAGG
jgi:hypothetical protein